MSLPVELIGKIGKCPSCSELVPISPTQEASSPEPSPSPDISLQEPFEQSPDAHQQAPPETPRAEPPAELAAPNVGRAQEPNPGRFSGISKYLIGAAVGAAITAGLFLLLGGA
jgi:hypothetical protein